MRTRLGKFLTILALATSLPCWAQVLKGSKPAEERPPNPNRLLLPSGGFSGGILTGVVIGPDDQPVANAPVALNGGMLMGVVIGEPVKKEEKQPSRGGAPEMGPNGGESFTDWQRTALDFCKTGPGAKNNPGPPDKPSFQWSGQPGAGGSAASPQWGGFSDAAGHFLVCVPPGTKNLEVSTGGAGGGSAVSVLVALDQPPAQLLSDPPSFCGRGAKFDLKGAFPRATAEQDGKVTELPVAMALGPAGEALSTVECSNSLHPGLAKLSITDGSSREHQWQTHIFQFVDGEIDRAHLFAGEPADFWYDVQMGPEEAGKSLCLNVTVAGPVVLTQPPAHKFKLDGSGRARLSGKIRATHVAPGSTVPFVIHPQFSECGR